MKLPSLNAVLVSAKNTFLRFPIALIFAITATFLMIFMLENQGNNEEKIVKFVFTTVLGISSFISITFLCEKYKFDDTKIIFANIGGLLLLVLYHFTISEKFQIVDGYRFAMLLLGLHLLISFALFVGDANYLGFWQFNKILFIRLVLSGLYSVVIYGGISLAIVAINVLFDAKINGEIFAEIWFVIVGIFNTWFFLAGMPKNLETEAIVYPTPLKIFTQFVLLPLVTLYLLILYAYIIKISINQELPDGIISWLVLCFSVSGIFSLLLIYPLQDKEDHAWIRIFSRVFYWALFPLIVLLFVAIFQRLDAYGITENRYYVLILTVWLLAITIFMIINKMKNIKIIPISLFFLAILSVYGPWSAFSVSLKSQISRFEKLLVENKILINGKVVKVKENLDIIKTNEISSIVNYINENHGMENFQIFFDIQLDTAKIKDKHRSTTEHNERVMNLMGLKYNSNNNGQDSLLSFSFSTEQKNNIPMIVHGYDYLFEEYVYTYDTVPHRDSLRFYPDSLQSFFSYSEMKYKLVSSTDTLILDFAPICNKVLSINNDYYQYSCPDSLMVHSLSSRNLNIKIILTNINGTFHYKTLKYVNSFTAKILLFSKKSI